MVSDANSNNQEEVKEKNIDNFVFLDDGPVNKDSFGCHENIANSIAERIEKDNKGKTIGLEGTWGSGKSSVIEMLEAKWKKEKNKNIKVFKYDAWEHQGDPLRRSFLEELITSLQKSQDDTNRWLKKCEKVKDNFEACLECPSDKKKNCPDYIHGTLRLRYEHNTIESKPTISNWGKWLAVATILMPIGVALFSAAKNLSDWYFWLGLIVMGLSPISIVGLILYCWCTGQKEILLELVGKTKEVTKHTTHRSPDPTTIEFQEYYWEILSLALEDKKRKLVIVVDNLDRVEPETALSIWGTMKTFLESSNPKEKDLLKRVWVIVPYDPDAIKKLWSNEKDVARNKVESNEKDKEKNKSQTQSYDLSLAFKEKTFQIRYHVPEPLTSKWEDYFNDRLKEAIKSQEDNTYHNIFHIFRIIALPKYNNIPTPREIKIFINRVVAMALQFYSKKDTILLKEIALYATMELEREDELKDLSGEIKDELKIKQFVGDNFREGLAAIHYGVTRSDANEVLYKPAIRDAIEKGNATELAKLLQNLATQKVCNNYINDNAVNIINIKDLATASSAFSKFSYKECMIHLRWCIRTLAEQLRNIDEKQFKINNGSWSNINAADLIRLMEFNSGIINILTDRLSIQMTEEDFGGATTEQINNMLDEWVTVVISILEYIRDNTNYDPTINLRFAQPEQYVKLLDIVQKKKKDVLKYFCPKLEVKEEYIKAYLKNIKTGTISIKDIDIVDGLLNMSVFEDEDERTIASSLVEYFSKMSEGAIPIVYEILYKHRNRPSFNEQLKTIVQNNKVFSVLPRLSSKAQVAALCFVNIFLFDNIVDAEKISADILKTYNGLLEKMPDELANEIAKTINKYKLFDEICNSLKPEIKEKECWGQILQQIVKDEKLIGDMSTQIFIKDHEYVKKHLDVDKKIGEEKINYYKKLVTHLSSKGLIENLIKEPINCSYGYAYYIMITEENIDSKKLEENLYKKLDESLETDNWYDELCHESDNYGVLDVTIELVRKHYDVRLKYKFVDALIKHSEAIVKGDAEKIDNLKNSWNSLLDAITTSERKHFREKLLAKINIPNKDISPLLEVYAKELELAIEKADKIARQDFIHDTCIRIATDKNQNELSWMLNLFSLNKTLIGQAEPDDKNILCDRLKEFLKNEYIKETPLVKKDVIENVAEQLDITLIEENLKNNKKEENVDNDEKN